MSNLTLLSQSQPTTDWLWYFLKRVPAENALLRAMEARFVDEATLPQPCLDLRNSLGESIWPPEDSAELYASAILIGTKNIQPTIEQLREISQRLATGGALLLSVPTANGQSAEKRDSADGWNQLLNQAGFHIERWQPFLDDNAQHASNVERRDWAPWLFELSGHHTLPWRRILDPVEANLRPYYEQRDRLAGSQLLFVATKAENAPVEQTLPLPPSGLTLGSEPEDVAASDSAESQRQTPTFPSAARPAARPRQVRSSPSAGLLLTSLIMAGAILAQFTMRSSPESVGSGIFWLLLALGGMLGLNQLSAERSQTSHGEGWAAWIKDLPASQISTVLASLVVCLLAYTQASRPLIALPLWSIAIIATALALFRFEEIAEPIEVIADRRQSDLPSIRFALPIILIFALGVRYYRLTAHPWVINGIEAQLGLDAISVTNVFSTGWLTNPTLPLFLTKLSVAIFGRTPFALRFLAPLIGTATVFAIYKIGKRLWDENVGLAAAILLAGSHFHIHYSRIGLTNIWDSLLTLLAMGGIVIAWQSRKRNAWLAAGAAIGFCAYIFTSAHLVPLMLVTVFVLMLLFKRDEAQAQWQHIAAAIALALVVALPQMLYFNANRNVFMERASLLGIQRNGWLTTEAISTGLSDSAIFRQQLWRAALGFTALLDRDGVYSPGVPLVNWLTGVFVLLGVGMAILYIRQPRYATLLVTIAITLVFGGALLVEVPHSRRYLIALPAVLLLAASTLVWLAEKRTSERSEASHQSRRLAPQSHHWLLIIVAMLALLDVSFYFGRYQNSHFFADRNTELAHEMADYLNELDGDWTAYFHGAPSIYISFSTLPFMLTEFEANINLFDVVDPTTLPPANSANVVHIFVPERVGEMEIVRGIRPNGTTTEIEGFNASPLFITYESAP